MKKYNLLKVIAIAIIFTWLLSLCIPGSYLDYNGVTTDKIAATGIIGLFSNLSVSISYFNGIAVFLIAIACFYAVLSKIRAYQRFVEKTANIFENKKCLLTIIVSLFFGILSLFVNDYTVLLIFAPLVYQIMNKLEIDKKTILASIIASSLVGAMCGIYNQTLFEMFKLDITNLLLVKLILFVISMIILNLFIAPRKIVKVQTAKKVEAAKKTTSKKIVKSENNEDNIYVNKVLYLVLTILFGSIGINKFYAGKTKQGIIRILFFWTGIPLILSIAEFIKVLFEKSNKDGKININSNKHENVIFGTSLIMFLLLIITSVIPWDSLLGTSLFSSISNLGIFNNLIGSWTITVLSIILFILTIIIFLVSNNYNRNKVKLLPIIVLVISAITSVTLLALGQKDIAMVFIAISILVLLGNLIYLRVLFEKSNKDGKININSNKHENVIFGTSLITFLLLIIISVIPWNSLLGTSLFSSISNLGIFNNLIGSWTITVLSIILFILTIIISLVFNNYNRNKVKLLPIIILVISAITSVTLLALGQKDIAMVFIAISISILVLLGNLIYLRVLFEKSNKDGKINIYNNKNENVIFGTLLITFLLLIITSVIPWNSLLGTSLFSIIGAQFNDLGIFNNLIGTVISGQNSIGINLIGSWTITDLSIILFILTIIISLVSNNYNRNKVKLLPIIILAISVIASVTLLALGQKDIAMVFIAISILVLLGNLIYLTDVSEIIKDVNLGIKKALPVAITAMLVSLVLVISVTTGINLTITNWLLGLTEKFNIITGILSAIIGSLLTSDVYYFLQTVGTIFNTHLEGSDYLVVASFILQSFYHFVMLIAPTSVGLVIGLYYLNIPYNKWIKYIWKALLAIFILLIAATMILFVMA